jgi:PAS domain S-box-containing protein
MPSGLHRFLIAFLVTAGCAGGTAILGWLLPVLSGPWPVVLCVALVLSVLQSLAWRRIENELAALRAAEYHWRVEALQAQASGPDWSQSLLFERIAEATPDILYIYDVQQNRNVYSNRGSQRIAGHTTGEIQTFGATLLDNLIHPDDRGWVIAELAWFAEHGRDDEVQDHQFRFLHSDGTYRWLRCRSVVFARDEQGRVLQILGVSQDVTEQRRAAEALRESEARFRVLAEAVPQIVWCSQPDGQTTYLNQRWSEYTGLKGTSPEELAQVIHPDDQAAMGVAWNQARTTGTIYQVEFRMRRAGGDGYRWFLARSVPVFDAAGNLLGWYGTSTDVDERKRAEERLVRAQLELEDRVAERTIALQVANEEYRLARDAAEAANRAKDEFLANMSHEIRTPIAGILGMTALALDSELSPTQLESLTLVRQSAEGLLTIINDILDYSKITAGKLVLDPQPFPLRATLDGVLKSLLFRAREQGISLTCLVAPEVPDVLVGDGGRLRQILLNLIGNAVKFTPEGGVEVRVELESSSADDYLLHLAILDSGVGIPADKLQAIFDPFVQVDGSMTRRYGGTGLGLTISSRLVEMMGGRIWVESVLDRGSTFHCLVRLERPLTVPVSDPAVATTPVPRRALNILLAEDNRINQRIAVGLLTRHGHHVHVAGNGRECLDRLAEQPYDVILMDVQMPEMDGLAATAAIRRAEVDTGRHMPIIAVTAHAMSGDRERFLDAGMDDYVTKPYKIEALLAVIDAALARSRVWSSPGAFRRPG